MVFSLHLVYLSTAACISEKINLGPCWLKDFKGSIVNDKLQNVTFCELMDAINMQSLSGHYLMRQQVSMVFSLHLVYLSTVACISEKIKLVPCWRKVFKGQKSRKIHKMLLFLNWGNKFTIIEWPSFNASTSTHGVFISFSLSRCCCLHYCRNKFGLMLVQGYFKGQRSSIIHILQLFMTLCDIQSSSGNYSMCHQVPMVSLLLLVYLSAVSYISVEISLGSCWRGDILRVKCKDYYKLQLLWICNHRVVITRCAIEYPRCFNFF